jgi:FAD/FMN-containing dehydrogenase
MSHAAPTAAANLAALRPAIDELRTRLRGAVMLPGEPGYDEARGVWNAMIDRRPGLIVRCLGVADVIAGVRFAREHELLLSIKGGGHNIAGLAVCDGGLTLDLSAMRGVWVDPGARTARVQPGCLLGDVDRETQLHGLATALGFVSNTGIAGLTLGGGFGYLTRRFGWTSDQVTALEMVTADGRIVRASERENADLFWGLRGGGGNFGVVTGFEYALHPLGPEMVGGVVAWPLDEAPRVLELWTRLTEQGPAELTCALAMRLAPPAAWLPPQVHGQPIVVLAVCHSGSVDAGSRDVGPIQALGGIVGDTLQRRTYASQQCLLDATQPRGRRNYWKSEYLPGIDPALGAAALSHARTIVSPHSGIILFPVGGALGKLSNDHSAVGNRDASVVVNIAGSWERAADDAANIEWARTAWRDLRRFSTGGTYVNFLTEEEVGDRIQAAYGDNLGRLIEIKSRWDPDNLFRVNKNYAPAATPRPR